MVISEINPVFRLFKDKNGKPVRAISVTSGDDYMETYENAYPIMRDFG
jgi:hypothetical protein